MAGLDTYLSLGLGIAGLYIAVKYGPQVAANLQQQSAAAPTAQQPQTGGGGSAPTAAAPAPVVSGPVSRLHEDSGIPPQLLPEVLPISPATVEAQPRRRRFRPTVLPEHDWKPTPGEVPKNAPAEPPVPSGHDLPKYPARRQHPATHVTPISPDAPNSHCVCSSSGKWEGPGCNVAGFTCSTPGARGTAAWGDDGFEAYATTYYRGYNIPWAGPQWYRTMRQDQAIASQATRIPGHGGRFMPGGFILTEGNRHNGYNNAYSAGT